MMATKREIAKALAGSIEKWRAIVEKRGADEGGENCPLCVLFFLKQDSCGDCPVAKAGHPNCASGPYDHWVTHDNTKHLGNGENLCGTCTRLARAELKFLESLDA